MPWEAIAGISASNMHSWLYFQAGMKNLAAAYTNRGIGQPEMAARGLQLLQQLDMADNAFQAAIFSSYESGNRFWLWQRLTKDAGINGGILNIEQTQDVPLHDHPGATGMIRMLEGEVEVWQYDRSDEAAGTMADGQVVLQRTGHR